MAGHPTVRHDEDLLGQAAIKETVRQAYLAVIGKPTDIAPRLYSAEELAGVPSGAVAQALGVGNPVRAAGLRPGEVMGLDRPALPLPLPEPSDPGRADRVLLGHRLRPQSGGTVLQHPLPQVRRVRLHGTPIGCHPVYPNSTPGATLIPKRD